MKTTDRPLDADLARLLEGNLPVAAANRLRRQLANESRRLEQDIRDLLQRDGSGVPGIEPAPASLRKKLHEIPGKRISNYQFPLRWSLSASLAVLLLALLVVFQYQPAEKTPSQAEVERARTELVIAFSYLRQVSGRSEYYMKREIGHTMQDALSTGILHGVAEKLEGG